jgi:bifunctional DNA-binding transcriptional regulator/antitoxin component of YhaV-PrlF toxin-antitoxin module
MPKVTSKLQLTLPKAIADQYGIRPGDELQWSPAGEFIRVVAVGRGHKAEEDLSIQDRLELFDKATQRQRKRQAALRKSATKVRTKDRGWKREDLYNRGLAD